MKPAWSWISINCLGIALSVLQPGTVSCQAPDFEQPQDSTHVIVAPPRELTSAVLEAKSQLEQGQTLPALQLLQFVLDHPEDYLERTSPARSLKRQVEDLLRSLPREARATYESQHKARAEVLRRQAENDGDELAARELFSRFPLTESATVAAMTRARRALDDGEPISAGRWWESVQTTELYARTPTAALQHGLAWMQAGLWERVDAALGTIPSQPLLLGTRRLSPPPQNRSEWLARSFAAMQPHPAAPLANWAEFRGTSDHNAVAARCGPIGPLAWAQSALQLLSPSSSTSLSSDEQALLQQSLESVRDSLQIEDRLTQPGFHPLVNGDRVIVRTPLHVQAHDLTTGRLAWRSVLSNRALQQTLQLSDEEGGLDEENAVLRERQLQVYLPETLLRNQTLGLLSSDDRCVYAVEQVPFIDARQRFVGMLPNAMTALESPTNRLVAYDLAGGRLLWELGGSARDQKTPLGGTYFLGPPTPLGGQLFSLAEHGNELRLLELTIPRESTDPPELTWSQVLATPRVPIISAKMRRLSGLSPAVMDNVLICPTSSGLVVAVDPIRRRLLWGYEYPSLEVPEILDPRLIAINKIQGRVIPQEANEDEGRWLDSAPTVAEGRVLLTPRDSTELHCVDALTGALLWKKGRERGLYVAGVVERRVILVTRDRVEALDLLTGEPAWNEPLMIAEPAGRGLLMGKQYLLPLATGDMIVFDTQTGRLQMRSRLSGGRVAGNLAAARGALVSQSLTEVIAFQALPALEQKIDRTLKQRPTDAESLALRGELRLHQGDEAGAVTDLRKALEQGPNPQAALVLCDLLMGRLKTQFPTDRRELDLVERLIQDENQRVDFLCLTAAGLERQGDLLAALHQYLKLASGTERRPPLTRLSAALTVRRDRIVRGHVWGLYDVASPDLRTQMDAVLNERAKSVAADSAGPSEAAGWEILTGLPQDDLLRFQRLRSQTGPGAIRPRLMEWERLADSDLPQVSGYAVGRLARDALERKSAAEAHVWLARLSRDFADREISPGQTGATLLKRWQPDIDALQDSGPIAWPDVPLEPQFRTSPPQLNRASLIEQAGPLHPVYRHWTFELAEENLPTLVARNGAGRRQWAFPLPIGVLSNQPQFGPRRSPPQLHIRGSIMALSLGTHFVVLDVATTTGTPRLLWQRSLVTTASTPFQQASVSINVEFMRSGRRRIRAVDSESDLHIGQLIGLTADEVFFQIGTRLIAADPITGQMLWLRYDVPRQTECTCDDRHVVLFDTIGQQAHVYRSADGEHLKSTPVADPHDWLWFRGTSLLSISRAGDQSQLQLSDLLRNQVVWSMPLTTSMRCTVVSDVDELASHAGQDEVICVDQAGTWKVLTLGDGREKSSGVAPQVPEMEFLWVQKDQWGYLCVAGSFSPPGGDRYVTTYDGTQVPITGLIWRIRPDRKEVEWKVDLEPTGFSVLQPPSLPIVAFAGRVGSRKVTPDGKPPESARLGAVFLDRHTGEVIYQVDQSPAPGMYQFEIDGDRDALQANFLTFQVDLLLPGAAAAEPGN